MHTQIIARNNIKCNLTQVTNSEIFNIIMHTNKRNITDIYNINMSLIKQLNQ